MNSAGFGLALETEMLDYTRCVLLLGIFRSNGRGLVRNRLLTVGCKCGSLELAGKFVLLLVIYALVLNSSECLIRYSSSIMLSKNVPITSGPLYTTGACV